MKLHIVDEFSPLRSVAVCYGTSIPRAEDYKPTDPQEIKWGWKQWDRDLLLKQQDIFLSRLQNYDVELVELKTKPELIWQMYTRDVAFVVGDTLYYAEKRTLIARNGEIEMLQNALQLDDKHLKALPGKIEGGDVVVNKGGAFVGISNRTNEIAIEELSTSAKIKPLHIGDDVMHLDTVLTLLPNNYVLACPEFFSDQDKAYLSQHFHVISVTKEERAFLGTNVFVVNPETIFVEESQKRVQSELKSVGFNIESVPYSEPIILGGSFRCTTLPLIRV